MLGHHFRKREADVRWVGPPLMEVASHLGANAERREPIVRSVSPRWLAAIFDNALRYSASDAGIHCADCPPASLLAGNEAVGACGAFAFGMTELAIREDELPDPDHLPLDSLRHTSCSSVLMRRSSGNARSRNCWNVRRVHFGSSAMAGTGRRPK